jgi:hypothetical protein
MRPGPARLSTNRDLPPAAAVSDKFVMIARGVIAMCVAAALAACSAGAGTGGIVTTYTDYDTLYQPSLYYYAADGRDVQVNVFGNPTPVPSEAWNLTVTDAMNRSSWVSTGHFTTTPDGSERGNFHFGLVFGATSTMSGKTACTGDVDLGALGPVDGRTAIVGAFCNNTRVVTTARVTVNAISSPDAPQLQPAMDQMLVKLLPRQDPNRPDRLSTPFFLN